MRHSTSSILALALIAVIWIPACGSADDGGGSRAADGADGSSADKELGGGTGTGNVGASNSASADASKPSSSAADFCSGKGPIVTLADPASAQTYETCSGRIAAGKFLNALCTCSNATVAGYLKTRSFDSVKGGPTDTGGSVGINEQYSITSGFTDVGGSLTIAGTNSLSFAGYLKVGNTLRTNGSATVAGYTKVGGDAWFASGFTDLGPVTIQGDLHSAAPIMGLPLAVNGEKIAENVVGPSPCPCAPADLLDVGTLVDDARTHNDNAKFGIDQKMLNLVVGNIEVTLPCGRFYLEQIAGAGNLIINVSGRVALFIEDDLAAAGNLEFRLAPSAEIDIFVKDNLVLTGRAVFGDASRPAASRIYVGGEGDVMLVGADRFVGNLYAPRSLVTAVGYVDVAGSVFARDFLVPGYANFVYDRAIQDAGDNCDAPPHPPTSCLQCGTCTSGAACVDGACGACRNDADCCSPLTCMDGICSEPLVML